MTLQRWDDADFCDQYEETWEISIDDVHYGWLAPGESDLQLLHGVSLERANVLDVGCGLGQNLVALAKRGAKGYGLDISACMLSKAERVIGDAGMSTEITLAQGDMRNFSGMSSKEFDAILSIYSMEYLSGVQELRKVIYNLNKYLKPGGVFLMCFSHPSQAHGYPTLLNRSVPHGVGKYSPFNYSFKDAVEALVKAQFSIERIVEQQTLDPSTIRYEEGRKYPYHFRKGKNPCHRKFDDISNGAPHTVVYRGRKLPEHRKGLGIPRRSKSVLGSRDLWGYRRSITRQASISYLGLKFGAVFLAPMDNVIGLVDVLRFKVTESDISKADNELSLLSEGGERMGPIRGDSVLAVAHRHAVALSLLPRYKHVQVTNADGNSELRPFMDGIVGLEERVAHLFGTRKVGLLCFVNGHEPSAGELPIDLLEAHLGDEISLVYVGYSEPSSSPEDNPQGKLFP